MNTAEYRGTRQELWDIEDAITKLAQARDRATRDFDNQYEELRQVRLVILRRMRANS